MSESAEQVILNTVTAATGVGDDSWMPILALAIAIFVGAIFLLVGIKPLINGPPTVLSYAKDFEEYPLIDKQVISHDTRKFTFGLPEGHVLGLPTGQHMSLKFTNKDGEAVQRSYTPVTDNHSVGKVSFIIKVYHAGVHPKFPDGGQMSQHLDRLHIGDTILMKGPKGHMEYLGPGRFKVKPLGKPLEFRTCDTIGMMAGGTGITPMLQILHAIFRNPADKTNVKLIYANQSTYNFMIFVSFFLLDRRHPSIEKIMEYNFLT
jgi:cytochrome-b5 reductase